MFFKGRAEVEEVFITAFLENERDIQGDPVIMGEAEPPPDETGKCHVFVAISLQMILFYIYYPFIFVLHPYNNGPPAKLCNERDGAAAAGPCWLRTVL